MWLYSGIPKGALASFFEQQVGRLVRYAVLDIYLYRLASMLRVL